MTSFLLFIFGFLFCFGGSITPSMLNITVLKISLEQGQNEVKKYALGISLVVIPQTIIAVFLTKLLAENTSILQTLEKLGIVIFILLSFYFYRESKKETMPTKANAAHYKRAFMVGITLSILNMFAIPYLCGTIIFLEEIRQFSRAIIPVLFFTLGCAIGTYFILILYGNYAKIIQKKTGKLTKNINLILAILTAFVALFSIIKLFLN
ncbi:LysE family transporter [uncultured Polaribacter sp.]|uniref:LysE family transporter n=1 Tax=uncultured Polaribacter sp. TaxID=174711 RepID=UPI002628B838|nr:LysE family transporter [uncultured Polaribacter sp.]